VISDVRRYNMGKRLLATLRWLIGGMAVGLLAGCQTLPVVGKNEVRYSSAELASFPYNPGPSPCPSGERPLSVAVVDPGWLSHITPLGRLNPPEHTLPTSHMYLHGDGGITVRAPGDVRLVRISQNLNISTGRGDYGLTFMVCGKVLLYMLHISSLTEELESAAKNGRCREYGGVQGGQRYRTCDARVRIKLAAGQEIGKVENKHNTFDIGAYRMGGASGYVDPSRYGERLPSVVCPLDLFNEKAGRALYAKVARKLEPRCGVDAQDVAGTLAGNWFQGDARADRYEDSNRHIAFVADNFDPSVSVISVGGTISNPGFVRFTPETQGRNNRAFREVTPGSGPYCFEGSGLGGHIIAELTGERRLRLEYRSGGCGEDRAFKNPVLYQR
jgi:hypothetical protein